MVKFFDLKDVKKNQACHKNGNTALAQMKWIQSQNAKSINILFLILNNIGRIEQLHVTPYIKAQKCYTIQQRKWPVNKYRKIQYRICFFETQISIQEETRYIVPYSLPQKSLSPKP